MRRTLAALTIAAGCAALLSASPGAGAAGADTDVARLQERVDRLEALTQRAEAISAIKRLQHAYGHYSELGLWHDFADLFADTGIGYYTTGALDREAIRTLFLKEVGGGRLGLADGRIYPHISMQPLITLAADGQSAKGRWHIMAMLGGYGTSASWAGGVYENQYVRENGTWKFKEVRYLAQYSGRYENPGWTPAKDAAPFQFDPARVAIGGPENPRPTAEGAPDKARPTSIADLAARAQRLSDEIEVTNLQHQYGYYVDRKMWDDVARLFAANGTMEIGLQGVYVGQKSIRRGLNAFGPAGLAAGETNDRVHLQTIVSVMPDGRTARARGTELGMLSPPSSSSAATATRRALWTQSIYENVFVKERGVWKIQSMRVYPRFIVDAAAGWAKDAQPAAGPSRAFPPDRPPTESYEIFPRFHIAPLHFDHPVTGRSPQYPEGMKVATRASSPAGVAASGARTATTTTSSLESLLTTTERSIARSMAYHAAENLATAHGFTLDEQAWKQSTLAIHHIVQPVIRVSADARSATIRARLFQLGNAAGGDGAWTSGIYESTAVNGGGTWKQSNGKLNIVWSAPSRGGWVRERTGGLR